MVNHTLWALARALYTGGKLTAPGNVTLDLAALTADQLDGITAIDATCAAAAAASCIIRQWDVSNRAMPPYLGLPATDAGIVVPIDAVWGMSAHDTPCVCDVWRVEGQNCTLRGSVSIVNTGEAIKGPVATIGTGNMAPPALRVGVPPAWVDIPFPAAEAHRDTDGGKEDGDDKEDKEDADGGADGVDDGDDWETPLGHPYASPGHPGLAKEPRIPRMFLRFARDGPPELERSRCENAVLTWAFITKKFARALAANTGSMNRGVLAELRAALREIKEHKTPGLFAGAMHCFIPAVYTLTLSALDAHEAARGDLHDHETSFEFKLFPRATVTPPKRGPLAMWISVLHTLVRRLIHNAHAAGHPVMPTVPNEHRGPGTMDVVCGGVKVKALSTPEQREPWLGSGTDPTTCATPMVAIRPWTAVPVQYIADHRLQVFDGKVRTWMVKGAVVTSDPVLLRELAVDTALATMNVVMHAAHTQWAWTRSDRSGPRPPGFMVDLLDGLPGRYIRSINNWGREMGVQDAELRRQMFAAARARVEGLSGRSVVGRIDMTLSQALSVSPPCLLGLLRRATRRDRPRGRHLKWGEVKWAQAAMTAVGVPLVEGKDGEPGFWEWLGRALDQDTGGAMGGDKERIIREVSHGMHKYGEKELAKDHRDRRTAWCSDAAKMGLCPFANVAVIADGEFEMEADVDVTGIKAWLATTLEHWGVPPVPLNWALSKKRPDGWTEDDDYGLEFMPPRKSKPVVCQAYTSGLHKDSALAGIDERAKTLTRVMATIAANSGAADQVKAAAVARTKARRAPAVIAYDSPYEDSE